MSALLNGLDLLFGDDDASMIDTQQQPGARQQPGPRVQNIPEYRQPQQARPQPRPQPPARLPARPPEKQLELNGPDLMFGDAEPAPASQPQQPRLARQRARPDTSSGESPTTILQRYINGSADPAYQGVKGFGTEDLASSANPELDLSSLNRARMVAPNDASYHDIIKQQLGPAYIRSENDKHGQPVVVFRDNAGAEHKRYVNQPGLDWGDVERAAMGAIPYMATGAIAGGLQKGAGLLANMVGQGATAAGTSLAANSASRMLGSNQPVDLTQTGIMAVAGAGGALLARPVGMGINKFITVPGLVDDAGNLTAKGTAAAQKAGLDPASVQGQIAREFAEVYAKTGSVAEAGARGTTVEFGLPASRGQITKDPQQLLNEKALRQGLYGDQAKQVMNDFDGRQTQALHDAALGAFRGAPQQGPMAPSGIAPMLAPSRGLADQGVDTLGPSIREGWRGARSGARKVEGKAWDDAGDVIASPEALGNLPQALQSSLGGFRPNAKLHPTASEMGEQIKGFMSGKMPQGAAPEVFGTLPTARVDEFRKQLYQLMKDATPGADKAAAAKVYGGFDDWLLQSAENNLLQGNVNFAVQNRLARDTTKEIRSVMSPMIGGKRTPAANILEKVMEKADSAEGIVQAMFGAVGQKSAPKDGSVLALQNMKTALHKWGDGAAGARSSSWDDVRLAYWTRMVQDKRGNVYAPQIMLNNIQNSIASQNSVMRVLYSGEELATMMRFSSALRHIAWKDPNPSGTATAAAGLTKEFATTMMRAIGWQTNGPVGLLLAGALTPIRNVLGSAGARSATAQRAPRTVDPNFAPYVTGVTQAGVRTDLGGQE